MCNPRRVQVTATREVNEAWERTVRRSVELSGSVSGEARVRQSLDDSVGTPALVALERMLSNGHPGWEEVDRGYRRNVEGGYVIYDTEERTLEIVATLEDQVAVEGESERTLRGTTAEEITVTGEGSYYDDHYGGRTEEHARKDAEANAENQIEQARREVQEHASQRAEDEASGDVEREARQRAESLLADASAARAEELDRQAADRLRTVGLRCRQEFHEVLALAYRDAILAYARAHGAEGIQCQEDGDVVEIEFRVER